MPWVEALVADLWQIFVVGGEHLQFADQSPWKQRIGWAKGCTVDFGSLLTLRQPRENGSARRMQFSTVLSSTVPTPGEILEPHVAHSTCGSYWRNGQYVFS